MTPAIAEDQALLIAQEIFTAMIDGEEGLLQPGDTPIAYVPAVHAWIDVDGDTPLRVVLTTHVSTAEDLSRALLALPADAEITDEDLIDAFGELANVVGGNVKSLLPMASTLGFPEVSRVAPDLSPLAQTLPLIWRGKPLTLSVHPSL